MKKIVLSLLGLFVGLLHTFSQTEADTTEYKSRKLKFEEANLVSGYYHQDGNNSAVTGGVGSEKLTDFSNTFDLKFTKWDKKNRQHTFTAELGMDVYTSASSDMIDLKANTSASYEDVRIYPSASWSVNNPKNGNTFGANGSFSTEYDYQSIGGGLSFAKSLNEGNTEFSIKANAYFDTWDVILPTELRTGVTGGRNNPTSPRNSYSASLTFAQVVTQCFQFALLADPSYQSGLLATKYQRVFFNNNAVQSENLPDKRWKLPLGVRGSYFVGDNVVLRGLYRFYTDEWGLNAHTANLEAAIKLSPFLSISPFYRFYTQTAADYFAPKFGHIPASSFYTSDYDLAKFDSHYFGAGIKWSPPSGVMGVGAFHTIELRYGHYERNTAVLSSDMISLNLKFK